MKTLLTAAAIVLLATTAHAGSLPKEMHGLWCNSDEAGRETEYYRDPCKQSAEGPLIIKPRGIGGTDHWCTLQSSYKNHTAKFTCRSSDGSKWLMEYTIRLEHNGVLKVEAYD